VREALAAAKACWDFWRSWALVALAPHLTPEQMSEALAAAKTIGDDDGGRARALAGLVPRLAPEQRDEVLREALPAATKATVDDETRARALVALIPHLAPEETDQVIGQAIDAVRLVSRSKALEMLSILAHSTFERGGAAALVEYFKIYTVLILHYTIPKYTSVFPILRDRMGSRASSDDCTHRATIVPNPYEGCARSNLCSKSWFPVPPSVSRGDIAIVGVSRILGTGFR
jgi:hypothetical protein